MNPTVAVLTIIAAVFAVLVIAVPVIGSLGICAPKWWSQKVAPLFPEREPSPPKWYFAPFRWIWAVVIFVVIVFSGIPIMVTGALIARYCYAWSTWIERKCPYTAENVTDDYHSQYQSELRFRRDWHGVIGGMWDAALRRNV